MTGNVPEDHPPAELLGDSLGGAGRLLAILRDRGGEVPFWRPSLATLASGLGWWWGAAAAVGAFLVLGWVVLLPVLGVAGVIGLKVVLVGVALVAGARSRAVRKVMAARHHAFCIHCGYSLEGVEDQGVCPECGMPFDMAVVEDYRRDPDWFIQRYRLAVKAEREAAEAARSR